MQLRRTWMSALFGLCVAGCGGTGSADLPAALLCKRLADCHELAKTTVSDCTNETGAGLDLMTDTRRNDCVREMSICLAKPSCDEFLACDLTDCE
jgi:hypothetical protein